MRFEVGAEWPPHGTDFLRCDVIYMIPDSIGRPIYSFPIFLNLARFDQPMGEHSQCHRTLGGAQVTVERSRPNVELKSIP